MTFLALTGLLNAITCASLGVVVIFKNPRAEMNRTFFAANIAIVVYSFGYFMWQMSATGGIAAVWFQILFAGIILVNMTFLRAVFAFLNISAGKKRELYAYYGINLVFMALGLAGFVYDGLEPRLGHGFWPRPLPLFHAYLAFWTWQCVYGFMLLVKALKNAAGLFREQLKYIIIASIVGFVGGSTNWPLWYKIDLPPYANILVSLYAGIVTYAIVKYRLMNIRLAFTRVAVFVVVYGVVLGVPLAIGAYTRFGAVSYMALFLLATVGPIFNRFLQGKVENVLMAQQKSYHKILYDAARVIVRERNIERLFKLIALGVKRAIGVRYTAIFFKDENDGTYRVRSIKGGNGYPADYSLPGDHPVIHAMEQKKAPLVYEEIQQLFRDGSGKATHLMVPSFINKKLMGFLAVGEKEDRSYFNEDDIRTFEILSNQAGLAIENCIFIDEKKRDQERLFQAEKLAFIGGMAEGVAHQIRNRLNHFSLATRQMQLEISYFQNDFAELVAQNPVLRETFESLNEIGESLIDNVKRTDAVIQGILNFARGEEKESYYSNLLFHEVVEGALDLARIKHDVESVPVKTEYHKTDYIYGIMTQMVECIYNIIDNCIESIEEKTKYRLSDEEKKRFTPQIGVVLTQSEDWSLIQISDNGVGIREEDRKKIFAPYFTTKSSYKTKHGSGIGLYVVHRMIEEVHGGKIWFDSEYMKGATFYIKLPRKKHIRPSAEMRRPG